MHPDTIRWVFILYISMLLVSSALSHVFKLHLRFREFMSAIRSGKLRHDDGRSDGHPFDVPRRWIQHIYIVGTLYSLVVLFLVFRIYVSPSTLPERLSAVFDFIRHRRPATVSATSACLGVVLYSLHIWKRLYEACCVSVFSDSNMSLVGYLLSLPYYLASLTAIIIEAPGFAALSSDYEATLSSHIIGFSSIASTCVFFWAACQQYKAAVILANLRKNEDGVVVTYEHKIPIGGMFDQLSSPHMFFEVLVYFALGVILRGHTIWPYVVFLIVYNQCEIALLTHRWYMSTFKHYPKNRKAILPFIL